VYEVTVT